jgi:hypothetical protein
LLSERFRETWNTVVFERDQPSVKCGIPEGGQQEAVVHVEALEIGVARFPGLDVGRAEQR